MSNTPETPTIKLDSLTAEQLLTIINTANEELEKKTYSDQSLKLFTNEYIENLEPHRTESYITSVNLSFKHLIDFFGDDKLICEITRKDINQFVKKLKLNAPKGYAVYIRNLSAAFNVAIDWEYIKVNHFQKLKLSKQQKSTPAYLTKDQLNDLLKSTEKQIFKDIFEFAFYTGMRRQEILNLKWKNIDLVKRRINVGDEQFTTKSKKVRFIPILNKVIQILHSRSNKKDLSQNDPDKLIFAKENGFSYHKDVPTKVFKKAREDAGLDDNIHFHCLRHSFASFIVQKNGNLYALKELMGHSSVKTTEIYAHLNDKALQEAIKVFEEA